MLPLVHLDGLIERDLAPCDLPGKVFRYGGPAIGLGPARLLDDPYFALGRLDLSFPNGLALDAGNIDGRYDVPDQARMDVLADVGRGSGLIDQFHLEAAFQELIDDLGGHEPGAVADAHGRDAGVVLMRYLPEHGLDLCHLGLVDRNDHVAR